GLVDDAIGVAQSHRRDQTSGADGQPRDDDTVDRQPIRRPPGAMERDAAGIAPEPAEAAISAVVAVVGVGVITRLRSGRTVTRPSPQNVQSGRQGLPLGSNAPPGGSQVSPDSTMPLPQETST